jgi:transposase-like protein
MRALSYRFPSVIIQHVVWLYLRFTLSFRDVQDFLVARGYLVLIINQTPICPPD